MRKMPLTSDMANHDGQNRVSTLMLLGKNFESTRILLMKERLHCRGGGDSTPRASDGSMSDL